MGPARISGLARGLALILGLVSTHAGDAAAQHPLNLGFERDGIAGPEQPWGWRGLSFAPGATASVDSAVAFEGARSFRISRPAVDDTPSDADASHTLMYWIPPLEAAGREARVAGRVRSAELEGGATVTIQSWAPGAFRSDTARTIGPADDDGWVPVEAAVRVDSAAHSLVVTMGLSGTGTAWFDGLAVEVDGRRLVDPAIVEGPPAAGLAWLDGRVHAIATVDAPEIPGSAGAGDPRATRAGDAEPDADLAPLARIVGDARVVALGEATHGTGEFFRAKHRLTRYLVEHLGFRVFLIEANQLPVERINEYVHGAPGEARDVMRTMFAVWNTEEVRDLIEWMRDHNARHPERSVSFVGFDMQDPSAPIDSLESTLHTLAPDLADTVRALHADFREAWRRGPYPRASEDVRRAWMEDAEEAWRLVTAAGPRLTEAAGERGDSASVLWAVQNANVVRQAAHSAFTMELPTRDSAMASNIQWTLDRRFPGARAVLWAHDAHISRGEHGDYDYYGGGSMGGVLSRALRDDYRAVGLLTYSGAYTGYLGGETLDVPLFPAPVGSLEEALHRLAERRGEPLLLADLRDVSPQGDGAWLLEPRPIRLIGFAAEDWGFAYPIVVARQFDAVLFVDESTPSRMLRRSRAEEASHDELGTDRRRRVRRATRDAELRPIDRRRLYDRQRVDRAFTRLGAQPRGRVHHGPDGQGLRARGRAGCRGGGSRGLRRSERRRDRARRDRLAGGRHVTPAAVRSTSSVCEQVAYPEAETGQHIAAIDLVSLAEDPDVVVRPVHRDRSSSGLDDPHHPRPRLQVVADLVVDLRHRVQRRHDLDGEIGGQACEPCAVGRHPITGDERRIGGPDGHGTLEEHKAGLGTHDATEVFVHDELAQAVGDTRRQVAVLESGRGFADDAAANQFGTIPVPGQPRELLDRQPRSAVGGSDSTQRGTPFASHHPKGFNR